MGQIGFLRETMLRNFEWIGAERPHIDFNGHRSENAIPERAARFQHLIERLDVALEYRAVDLRQSEKADIRDAHAGAKSLFASFASRPPNHDWSDLVRHACLYRRYRKVRWLDLPAKLPWNADDVDP